jgi:hypothetical protein
VKQLTLLATILWEGKDDDHNGDLLSQLLFLAFDLVENDVLFTDTRKQLSDWGLCDSEPVIMTSLSVDANMEWNENDIAQMLQYHASMQLHRNDETKEGTYVWGDYAMNGWCLRESQDINIRITRFASVLYPQQWHWQCFHFSF